MLSERKGGGREVARKCRTLRRVSRHGRDVVPVPYSVVRGNKGWERVHVNQRGGAIPAATRITSSISCTPCGCAAGKDGERTSCVS